MPLNEERLHINVTLTSEIVPVPREQCYLTKKTPFLFFLK